MNLTPSVPMLQKIARLKLKAAFLNIILLLDHPLICFVFVFLGYLLFSAFKEYPFGVTPTAQYNYLADAFLHGQIALRVMPPTQVDLVLYHAQYYVYYSPFPALLFLPFVAIFGIGFSDILATMLIGTLNVVLLSQLLKLAQRRGLIQLSGIQRVLLSLTFAFGTTQLILATQGKVWFTGHIVVFACTAFAYFAVLRFQGRWAFFLAGLGMAGAFATRNNAVLVGLWPAWFLLKENWHMPRQKLIQNVLLGLSPLLVTGVLLLAYNWVRFGAPLDNGVAYHQMDAFFRPLYEKYGFANLAYLPTNIYYHFIYFPMPWSNDSYMGGSLFLMTPLYFASFFALWKGRRESATWMWFVTFVVGYLPYAVWFSTGWGQIGPRYLLDLSVPLLLLTARGIKGWSAWILLALLAVAFYIYFKGLVFMSVA